MKLFLKVLFLLLLISGGISGQYLNYIFNIPDEVVLWRQLEPAANLSMNIYDDFEERLKWKVSQSHAIETTLRFIDRTPVSEDPQYAPPEVIREGWDREIDILQRSSRLHKTLPVGEQRFSQELNFFVNRPGLDYVIIEPQFPGKQIIYQRPVAVSVWVYGTGKKHSFHFIFSSISHKNIQVKAGDLNFYGWRRFEVTVPSFLQERNRFEQSRFEFTIEGIKVTSSTYESTGSLLFIFDMVTFMTEVDELKSLPGSEISDNWDAM